jgi:hypothetical protein
MSGARSRRKGKVGERELARLLSSEGFPARRGAQHRGGPDSPDVLCPSLPSIHFEAKRCERLRIYDAIDQARREAGEDQIPVVCHRRNASLASEGSRSVRWLADGSVPWLAVLTLTDLLAIVRESDYVSTSTSTEGAGISEDELHSGEVAP